MNQSIMITPHATKSLATVISPNFESSPLPPPGSGRISSNHSNAYMAPQSPCIPAHDIHTGTPTRDNHHHCRKRLSKIGSGIGPAIPSSLLRTLQGKTHLNLHANQLKHLHVDVDLDVDVQGKENDDDVFEALEELDVSSNDLGGCGRQREQQRQRKLKPYHSTQSSMPDTTGISSSRNLLSMLHNLQYLNLSANNLTTVSLSYIFSISSVQQVQQDSKKSKSKSTPIPTHVLLPNLVRLNLSHNQLGAIPPYIGFICPKLHTLSLLNNRIQSISDVTHAFLTQQASRSIEQHSNTETYMDESDNPSESALKILSLQNETGNRNPVCNQDSYRHEIIYALPHLIELDGVEVTNQELEERRRHSRASACCDDHVSVEHANRNKCMINNQQTKNKNSQSILRVVERATEASACKGVSKFKNPSTHQRQKKKRMNSGLCRQDKLQRATEHLSLHKLNQLENQVIALSQIAGEQAEATQKLLYLQEEKRDRQELMMIHPTRKPEEKEYATSISESQMQTNCMHDSSSESESSISSASEFPSPPVISKQDQDLRTILFLQLAVEKWRMFVLSKRTIESVEGKDQELKDVRHEYEKKLELLQVELSSKNEKILIMQKQKSMLSNNLKKRHEMTKKIEEKHKRDLQTIACMAENELENIHNDYRSRLHKEQHRADAITKKYNKRLHDAALKKEELKNKLSDIHQNLLNERNSNRSLIAQLHSRENLVQMESKKLQEVKRANESTAKRSANAEATTQKMKLNLLKASKFMSSQKEQLRKLNEEIRNKQQDYSEISIENDTLKKNLQQVKARKEELLQIVNKNEATIRKYKRNTKLLHAEIDGNKCHQEEMMLRMKESRKEMNELLIAHEKLQLESEQVHNKLTRLKIERKSGDKSKIGLLREAKKKYKKEARHLLEFVEDLKEELSTRENIIHEQSSELARVHEEHNSILSRYDTCQQSNRDAEAHIKSMKENLQKLVTERDELTQTNMLFKDEVSLNKDKHRKAEEKISFLQSKLDERAQKAKMALSQLCEGFAEVEIR